MLQRPFRLLLLILAGLLTGCSGGRFFDGAVTVVFDTFEENGDDVLVSGTASGEINRHETIDGEENMNDSLPVDLRFKATLKKLDT